MHKRIFFLSNFLCALMLFSSSTASAQDTPPTSPWDLISQTNVLRESYGYADLSVDGILMATAQSTAEIMASYQSCTHLASMGYPNASARAMAAGYGGGATAFVTENIACGVSAFPDLYSTYWADYEHLRPVNGPQAGLYIHAGAGAAQDSTGKWYYVLQVGYTSGSYNASTVVPTLPGGITATFGPTTDQRIFDIVTATANSDGSIIHVVQPGQTLWGIADTYKVDAAVIKALNGMTVDTIYPNQKLIIRTAFTPTISPTITETPKPATRTPRPTSTPLPPTQTLIPSVTPTPTRAPLFPEITFMQGNRRILGFGIIVICAAGLVFLALSGRRRR